MKHLILILVLGFSFSAQAETTIADEMKVIGEQFRTIALAIRAKAVSENEAKAAKAMQRAVANSSLIYPDSADTDEAKLQYGYWMAQLMKKSLEMEDAIEAQLGLSPQDVSGVQTIFNEMNELRGKGHQAFK